ncbi:MAG: hypothetical protein BGO12_23075 [Verrucomicrobia bacterium 61-8]|nr:Verru_Chthon cassette protein B [Verrucomicrobiota bacterium]OJU98582.1 MAG: hypothetical protein BGO12_23075 [Verrucomicrobia bacterium 61-8]
MPNIIYRHILEEAMFPTHSASSVKARLPESISSFQKQEGFTLVEVTLALGLTIFAVMTVVGLLPVGLGGLRQAADDTVRAQIIKELDARLCMADSSALFAQSPSASAPVESWFDSDGQVVSSNDQDARFYVRAGQETPQFPGSDHANDASTSLRVFRIEIEDLRTHTRTKAVLHVANNGH